MAGEIGRFMPGSTDAFFDDLARARVVDHNGNEVRLGSVWQHQRVLIRVFRRLGCAYCRGEAKILSQIAERVSAANVRMLGVGTDYGADEWRGLGYWRGDFYTSPDYDVHKHVQGTKKVWGKGLGTFGQALKVKKAMPRMINALGGEDEWKATVGNRSGTDEYYGSVLLVGPGDRLHYAYLQNYPADFPANDELLAAIESAERRQPVLAPPVVADEPDEGPAEDAQQATPGSSGKKSGGKGKGKGKDKAAAAGAGKGKGKDKAKRSSRSNVTAAAAAAAADDDVAAIQPKKKSAGAGGKKSGGKKAKA